jgi:putative nucleotidyltransferase with HDIG domain
MASKELKDRLQWIIMLRWIGIAGVIAVTHIVRAAAFLSFSLVPVYGITGFAALYNIFFTLLLRRPRENFLRLAVLQILLDQITLSLAMYFSGGCDSPFIYFFIFHVVISGILLPQRYAFGFTALAAIFPATVMELKHIGVLPHVGIFRDEPMIFTNFAVMGSYGAAFVSTLILTAYFVNYLGARLQQSREELKISNIKLSTLLDASRLTTSTLQIEQSLSDSLRVVLNIERLKVGVVLLLEGNLSQQCYEYHQCSAHDCPAYKTETSCWRLSNTLCRKHDGQHETFDEKLKACVSCGFFSGIVLGPRIAAGLAGDPRFGDVPKPDHKTITRALVAGHAVIGAGAKLPFSMSLDATTELAIPLQAKEQIIGVLYLDSDQAMPRNADNREFFQLLIEVISAGILNGRIYEDMEASYLQTVAALSNAVEAKDPYTRGHSERVAEVCARMAGSLKVGAQEKEYLRFAAILHDVGKIGIDRDILLKQHGLDGREAGAIRTHPDKGAQILDPISFLKPVLSAIRHHHENFDGTGYPLGLKGKEIPYKARIIRIADAWDAMTSERAYRRGLSPEEASNELIRHAGTHFDPELVETFRLINNM